MSEPAVIRRTTRVPASGLTRVLTLALVVVVTVTGCVSIPTKGPVVAGRSLDDAPRPPRVRFFAVGPIAGDSPAGIVRGFLRAAADFSFDHTVARSFLTADKRTTWRPDSPVVIYAGATNSLRVDQISTASSRSPVSPVPPAPTATPAVASSPASSPGTPQAGARATVQVQVPVLARIRDRGVYLPAEPNAVDVISFRLTVVDGQWRIADPADGVLISRGDFSATFGEVPLYFPDRTGGWLVPDVRWFPLTSSPTVVASALLAGPSSWLTDAVGTGAPSGTELTASGVHTEGGRLLVDLTRRALEATPAQRQLLHAQLRASLAEAATVLDFAAADVVLTVEQAAFEVPLAAVPPSRTAGELTVDNRPIVLDSSNRIARLNGSRATAIPALARVSGDLSHPASSLDGRSYAVLTGGRSTLVTLSAEQGPRGQIRAAELTAPSFDVYGWAWTSPGSNAGVVYAVRGTSRAVVRTGWLGGYQLQSLRISREGGRALVVATHNGRSLAFVTGVVRDRQGRPQSLTQPALRLVSDLQGARDGAWLDSERVVILGTRPSMPEQAVWVVQVGGETALAVSAPAALSITAGNSQYDLWAQLSTGVAYRAGASFLAIPDVRWPAVPG